MKSKIILLFISSILIIVGLTLKTSTYYHNYLIQKQEINTLTNFFNNQIDEEIAILEIPKINLKKTIQDNQNVDEGIMVIDKDKLINNDIILAAHSGNCDICYFDRLDELKKDDLVYFYYNHIKLTFKILEIQVKRKLTFMLPDKENTITLITCQKDNRDYQLIIIGQLIDKENY